MTGTMTAIKEIRNLKEVRVYDQISEKAEKFAEDAKEKFGLNVISCPSVRKAVAGKLNQYKFVLVYTPSDGILTSIPVMADDLCSYDSYYGTQKLEDLKLWTKKGR